MVPRISSNMRAWSKQPEVSAFMQRSRTFLRYQCWIYSLCSPFASSPLPCYAFTNCYVFSAFFAIDCSDGGWLDGSFCAICPSIKFSNYSTVHSRTSSYFWSSSFFASRSSWSSFSKASLRAHYAASCAYFSVSYRFIWSRFIIRVSNCCLRERNSLRSFISFSCRLSSSGESSCAISFLRMLLRWCSIFSFSLEIRESSLSFCSRVDLSQAIYSACCLFVRRND